MPPSTRRTTFTSPSSSTRSSSVSSASWRSSRTSSVSSCLAATPPRTRPATVPNGRSRGIVTTISSTTAAARATLRVSQLLFEIALAAGSSLLALTDGLVPVARAAERRDPVREARGEAGDLLDRARDRHAHGPYRRVRAIGHVHCAVRHLIHLVQLQVHLVDALAELVDHRQQLVLRPPNKRGKPRKSCSKVQKDVREARAGRHEEERECVVRNVARGDGKERHARDPSRGFRSRPHLTRRRRRRRTARRPGRRRRHRRAVSSSSVKPPGRGVTLAGSAGER